MKDKLFMILLIAIFGFLFQMVTVDTFSQSTTRGKDDLIVNFISIGQGIDSKTKARFLEYLSKFETENKIKLAYQEEAAGREGEVKYRFDLNKMEKKKRKKFADGIRKEVRGSKLVRIDTTGPW